MAVEIFSQELAPYLAGLIDGDGSITIRRRDRKGTPSDRTRGISFIVRVCIGGEPAHLTGLRNECGGIGNLWIRKREKQRHLAEWAIAGGQARNLLLQIVSSLRLKRRQAEAVLAMPAPRSRWGATPELRHQQECARVTVSELNRMGRGKAVAYGH